jgi:hypothetical protein
MKSCFLGTKILKRENQQKIIVLATNQFSSTFHIQAKAKLAQQPKVG